MTVSVFNMTDTWNNAGVLFHAIKMNVTNTASAAGSKLMELLNGSVSQFAVDPSQGVTVGALATTGPGTVNAAGYFINGTNLASVFSTINDPTFTGDPKAPTPVLTDNDTSIATTAFVKGQGYVSTFDLAAYAPLASPAFTGTPTAPTPPAGASDLSIATTAWVQNKGYVTGGPYQPLDGDLTSLASATGSGVMYYRSGTDVWLPVLIGPNISFSGGVLSATGGGGGGGGAPTNSPYIVSASDPTLTAERVLTDTASIVWDFSTPGQAKASTAIGGGNVSNSGTPTANQYARWVTATTIAGVAPATVLTDIGAQPLDGDLTSLAAASATNAIYYRSAANTWAQVTIGTGLSFSSGTLSATVSGSFLPLAGGTLTGDLTVNTNSGTNITVQGNNNPSVRFTATGASTSGWIWENAASRLAFGNDSVELSSLDLVTGAWNFGTSPIGPTPATADDSTKLATTAFVKAQGYAVGSFLPLTGGTLTGNLTINGSATPILLLSPTSGATKIAQIWQTGDVLAFGASGGPNIATAQLTNGVWTFAVIPLSVTPATADNSTAVATTAFVKAQGYTVGGLSSSVTATLTVGYTNAIFSIGNITSGTVTPTIANGAFQTYTNNGAHTLAPQSVSAMTAVNLTVEINIGATAGTINTAGFTKVDGDLFDTVNGHIFRCYISIMFAGIGIYSHMNVKRMV